MLLYAITYDTAEPPSGIGLDGRPLRGVGYGSLRAVIGDTEPAPPPDRSILEAYERVVETLMERETLLPARYGTTAASDAQITAMLVERYSELCDALERVQNAVEFAVHLPKPPTDWTGERSGTDYMHALVVTAERTRELAGTARAHTRRDAYLVDRDRAHEFLARASALGATVTGPWPPYSFVTP